MIAVGGENLIDYVQISKKINYQFTELSLVAPYYNVAIAAARQGQQVCYLTPISDSLGTILASRLEADGVKVCAPRVRGQLHWQLFR